MRESEQLVSVILLAGELLLTSGAEIYRVEETVERMGKCAGFSQVEVFAAPTGIFITFYHNAQVFTRVRRIRRIDNNLARIAVINSLSRGFADGIISAEQLDFKLKELRGQFNPTGWDIRLAGGIGSGAFAFIFGGQLNDSLAAACIGVAVLAFISLVGENRVPRFLLSAAGSLLAASLGLFLSRVFGLNTDITILAGVMVLVPGVTMTNAVRDMLSGELVSGVARGAEALSISLAVAAGVAVILGIGGA